MFRFKAAQKVFEIGKVRVGGQPGENPTVLVGSLFYHGHKLLRDEGKGEVDREGAEKLIKLQEEFSDKTGNPGMIDLVISSEEAVRKLLNFVSDVTEAPIMVDSPDPKVKMAGARHASEVGLTGRVVYNSLILESKPTEYEVIKECGLQSAILLLYKSGLMTSGERVKTARELLSRAEAAGVTKPLVDTFVIDVPSLSMAGRAMLDIKGGLGVPCGCGAHNAISTWSGFKKRMGADAVKPCSVAIDTVPVALGADFVLYGPMEDCRYVFPAVYALYSSYKYLHRMKEYLEL